MDVEQAQDADYVLQFWSAEKGGSLTAQLKL